MKKKCVLPISSTISSAATSTSSSFSSVVSSSSSFSMAFCPLPGRGLSEVGWCSSNSVEGLFSNRKIIASYFFRNIFTNIFIGPFETIKNCQKWPKKMPLLILTKLLVCRILRKTSNYLFSDFWDCFSQPEIVEMGFWRRTSGSVMLSARRRSYFSYMLLNCNLNSSYETWNCRKIDTAFKFRSKFCFRTFSLFRSVLCNHLDEN